ncbi:uncharacterized protein BJ212DRAFT_147630 [Suillus subaureus]|uniref:Uncharacterized protein n=1 Tax=Suillus subaureus TaxID=48587 RepID=A0A9P7JE50_9AGAM|nr:uncharacterized protein BJ212DRAFT_147630 [Suillus subaureus]KAG1817047.1 hypothetical protein BJ212DRAFT_147630 [Suillus subaureus]
MSQFPPKHTLAKLNVPLICNKTSDFSIATESISSNPIATEPCSISSFASISPNLIANDSCCTSPSTCTLCTPLLPTSPIWNAKRLSIDSDTTLVDHDDDFVKDCSDAGLQESIFPEDDSDCSSGDLLRLLGTKALTIDDSSGPSQRTQLQPIILKDRYRTTSAVTDVPPLVDASPLTTTRLSLGSIPPQIVTPRLKPPDTKRHHSFRPGRHKHESRSARLAAARDSMKHARAKQLEHITMIGE